MTKRIEIIEETEVFKQAIFRVVAATLKFELYDGTMSDKLVRLNLDRGDSVAALIHDVQNDVLLVTEQFRYPTHEKGPGWLTEIVAGMVDTDEAPADSMRREIWEEVGYRVSSLQHIGTFYLSPGGSSERIHLYYSAVDQADRGSSGGGKLSEGEDVLVMKMPVDQALEELDRGRIMDAKTMIALQWLALNRDTL
jgi:nudix-type nucleoside diphosphatase (YffH/AdpP family)